MTRTVRVRDVATQIRGVSYTKGEAIDSHRDGYVALLRAGNITEYGVELDDLLYVPEQRVSKDQRLQENDVLIAASSGSLDVVGKAARVPPTISATFGAFCKVLRPGPDVDPAYFAHYFQTPSYRRRVSAAAAGININNLRNEDLDNLAIELPSLKEQRRIAEVLNSADIIRAKRRAALEAIDDLKQAVFREMFDTARRSWPDQSLQSLVTEFRYGTSEPSKRSGDYPVLRIPNIVHGAVDFKDLKFVALGDRERDRLRLDDGDLLFVRTNGNPYAVGRCAVFERARMPHLAGDVCVFASYLIRARLDASRVRGLFLQEFMSSPQGRAALREVAKTSAGQYNVNIEGLSRIRVSLPPLELQDAFAARALSVERMKLTQQTALAELDGLFASLQHRAFKGTL